MRGIREWEGCLRYAQDLPPEAREDVEAALRRVNRGFPRLVGDLASDFGLEGDDADLRRDACILEFTAIQVADDLADADCNYLPAPERTGPGLHWLLQHLTYSCLMRSRVSKFDIDHAARDFAAVGGAQQVEVRTSEWTFERSAAAAAGLNGRQYSAYFRILSSGTRFADRAADCGADFGLALHVVTDQWTNDRRWTSLDEREKALLASIAREAVRRASKAALPALGEALAWFEAVLGPSRKSPTNPSRREARARLQPSPVPSFTSGSPSRFAKRS